LAHKNADKIHNNISASKMHKNSKIQKIRQIYKILALFQKSGGFPKFRRIFKIQAPAENQAALLFRLG
jgi:hypothetical protein